MRKRQTGEFRPFFALFIAICAIVVVSTILANTQGEPNIFAIISGTLGMLLSFPWILIPKYLTALAKSDWDPTRFAIVVSVLINTWIVYKLPTWFSTDKDRPRDRTWLPVAGVLIAMAVLYASATSYKLAREIVYGRPSGVICVSVVSDQPGASAWVDTAFRSSTFKRLGSAPLGTTWFCKRYDKASMDPIRIRAYPVSDANTRQSGAVEGVSDTLVVPIDNRKKTCVGILAGKDPTSPAWTPRIVECGSG